jgi:hypothetical protein
MRAAGAVLTDRKQGLEFEISFDAVVPAQSRQMEFDKRP